MHGCVLCKAVGVQAVKVDLEVCFTKARIIRIVVSPQLVRVIIALLDNVQILYCASHDLSL